MRLIGRGLACCLAALSIAGCAYVGPSEEAKQDQRYEEYAPKFTGEQKANMSLDEKLAIYNAHVEIDKRLTCRMEYVTGSHFKVARCFTRGELRDQLNAAQDFMRRAKR